MVREIDPELCFYELAGRPMTHRKASQAGKDERLAALGPAFSDLDLIERNGGAVGLDVEDILDAAAACWSAGRLAAGQVAACRRSFHMTARGCRWRSGGDLASFRRFRG